MRPRSLRRGVGRRMHCWNLRDVFCSQVVRFNTVWYARLVDSSHLALGGDLELAGSPHVMIRVRITLSRSKEKRWISPFWSSLVTGLRCKIAFPVSRSFLELSHSGSLHCTAIESLWNLDAIDTILCSKPRQPNNLPSPRVPRLDFLIVKPSFSPIEHLIDIQVASPSYRWASPVPQWGAPKFFSFCVSIFSLVFWRYMARIRTGQQRQTKHFC
jgi:hypothetical protein